MKQAILAAMLFCGTAYGQLFPFSIGGQGLATDVSQCQPPAPNYAGICPVIGAGWMSTFNGSAYASWVGLKGDKGDPGLAGAAGPAGSVGAQGVQGIPGVPGVVKGSILTVTVTCPPGVSAGVCGKTLKLTVAAVQ